jgi:predicted SnoaL-like aldol condensation-catalyzing enzyme
MFHYLMKRSGAPRLHDDFLWKETSHQETPMIMKDLSSQDSPPSRRVIAALTGIVGLGLGFMTKILRAQETSQTSHHSEIEQIYKLWDDALGKKDLEASLALYADDASIESPLVRHLLKTNQGIVKGKENLRQFITLVFQTNPLQRKRFRTGFFTDGRRVTWEYPRVSPEGTQMDLFEVMEVENGLIKAHRVYWGWYALKVQMNH